MTRHARVAAILRWLAASGVPDMMAEDFLLKVTAEAVQVFPVRAGQVCRNFQGVAWPRAQGEGLLAALKHTGDDRS